MSPEMEEKRKAADEIALKRIEIERLLDLARGKVHQHDGETQHIMVEELQKKNEDGRTRLMQAAQAGDTLTFMEYFEQVLKKVRTSNLK